MRVASGYNIKHQQYLSVVLLIMLSSIFVYLWNQDIDVWHILHSQVSFRQHNESPTLTLPQFNLIFVHIPKNGGTLVEHVFRKAYNIAFGVDFWRTKHHCQLQVPTKYSRRSACSPWHIPLSEVYPQILEFRKFAIYNVSDNFGNTSSMQLEDSSNSYQQWSTLNHRQVQEKISSLTENDRRNMHVWSSWYYSSLFNCQPSKTFRSNTVNETSPNNQTIPVFSKTSLNVSNTDTQLFAIVRNPYERFMTQFHWILKYAPSWLNIDGWRPPSYCSVTNFNKVVNRILLKMLRNKNYQMHGQDCHLAPQTSYTHWKGQQIIKHLLHTEHLVDEFLAMLDQFSNTQGTMTAAGIQEIQKKVEHPGGSCYNVTFRHLTEQNIQLLNKVYKRDFELLGYKMYNVSLVEQS